VDSSTKQNLILPRRRTLCFFAVCATTACFRPAPPLEEGDGLTPSYSTQVEPDGTTTIKGHPEVLNRQRNEPKTIINPTQTAARPSMTPTVTSPSAPALSAVHIVGLRPTLKGTCNPAALSHTATTTSGGVQSVTCDGHGVLSVLVHLPAGSSPFSVTVSTTHADGSRETTINSFTRTPFVCPSGYVGVPGSGIPGLGNVNASKGNASWWLDVDRDFCVMKYPARIDGNGNLSSSLSLRPSSYVSKGIDETSASSALKQCRVQGQNYKLLSNTHWQTVARNAESLGENWSGGKVGDGVFARGHTDNSPGHSLAFSYDADPYFETLNDMQNGWDQRRTHALTNTEIVWDFGGNLPQWTYDDIYSIGLNPSTNIPYGMQEFSNLVIFPVSGVAKEINRLLFGPSGNFNSTQKIGKFWGQLADVVIRGGLFGSGNEGGAFSAYLRSGFIYHVGFRCAYLPQ